MKFFPMFPPRTKILVPPLYRVYILYIYVVTCVPPKFIYVADPMTVGMYRQIVFIHTCIQFITMHLQYLKIYMY